MPAKRLPIETQPHYLHLRKGDFDFIRAAYPDLPVSHVIRALVSHHVEALRARAAQVIPDDDTPLHLQEIEDEYEARVIPEE